MIVCRNLILNATERSCCHFLVEFQWARLLKVGYSPDFLIEQQFKVFSKLNLSQSEKKFEIGSEKCVVIPYFHGFSHLLRKIATPLEINVIFSYNCKFETLASSG